MPRNGFAPAAVILAVALLLAAGAVSLPRPLPVYQSASPLVPLDVAAAGWFSSWWSRFLGPRPPVPPVETPPGETRAAKPPQTARPLPAKPAPVPPPPTSQPKTPSRTFGDFFKRSLQPSRPPASSPSQAKISPIFEIPCRPDPNVIFDQTFAPLDQIKGIVPSGAAASEEIKPHSYVDLAVESIPLYAPADLELVEGAYYYEPPTFKVATTYSFHFQVSCEVVLMLDHITDPVEKLKNAFPATPHQDTRSVRVRPTVRLAKGEFIGYTKGGGTQSASPPINRFDLGLYRTTNTNRFVNQARYEQSRTWKYLHAVCPYDYFSPELKDAFYAKFWTLDKVRAPGSGCRSPNQDKAETLAGAWFFRENSLAIEPHVGIILELDGGLVTIAGLPQQGAHTSISRLNSTFKDPAAVTTGHCYFSPHGENRVVYFRLLSPLKAEVYISSQASACPASFPTGGTMFLYR